MSTSTDGIICCGILLGEDVEFPWEEEYDGDEEEWWYHEICLYEKPFEIYDAAWKELPGITPERKQEYWDHWFAFKEAHPLPITLVNYCHIDAPMYILAVPASTKRCSRGYPQEFEPTELVVTEQEKNFLLNFCRKYLKEEIQITKIKWYLCSYWG